MKDYMLVVTYQESFDNCFRIIAVTDSEDKANEIIDVEIRNAELREDSFSMSETIRKNYLISKVMNY